MAVLGEVLHPAGFLPLRTALAETLAESRPPKMKCPHCAEGVHEGWLRYAQLDQDVEWASVEVEAMRCPDCSRWIVRLDFKAVRGHQLLTAESRLVHPRASMRPVPPEVTGEYAEDFKEAVAVAPLSPKASAAVSRRLLQHIIREKAGIRRQDLNAEIDALMESEVLPSDLATDLDALRTVGNFAAHPTKSTHTGEVVEVEPGEAEWLLELLEELLDFYFVRPAIRERKRAALNEKLAAAEKPALKGTAAA